MIHCRIYMRVLHQQAHVLHPKLQDGLRKPQCLCNTLQSGYCVQTLCNTLQSGYCVQSLCNTLQSGYCVQTLCNALQKCHVTHCRNVV